LALVTNSLRAPRICDAVTGKEALVLDAPVDECPTTPIAWSPDGTLMAAGYETWTVQSELPHSRIIVWDAVTGKQGLAFPTHIRPDFHLLVSRWQASGVGKQGRQSPGCGRANRKSHVHPQGPHRSCDCGSLEPRRQTAGLE